jgi:ribonuclease P protein component
MGIPRSHRLRLPREFQKVRDEGQRIHRGSFILQCRVAAAGGDPRLGVIASRRVGNAVLRNRGRRLVREVFRKEAEQLPPGTECVVVLRRGFEKAGFTALERQFHRACAEALADGSAAARSAKARSTFSARAVSAGAIVDAEPDASKANKKAGKGAPKG